MSIAEIIRRKIEAAFSPARLDVEDESHKHAGHAGAREGGETHFRVTIVSSAFEGKSRVDRHRAVTAALREEMGSPIHALALKTMTPAEAAKELQA